MGHTYARTVRNHYANHDQPTPHTNTHARARALVACGIGKVGHKVCGGHSTGETPSNIPNLEAKPGNANGTAIDRSWESRTPPQHNHTKTTRPPPPLPARRTLGWGAPAYPHPPTRPEHTQPGRTQHAHTRTQHTTPICARTQPHHTHQRAHTTTPRARGNTRARPQQRHQPPRHTTNTQHTRTRATRTHPERTSTHTQATRTHARTTRARARGVVDPPLR